MNSRTYILLGDPVPLARARMSPYRVYDSQKQIKLVAGINLRNQHNDEPLLQGPLLLDVTFTLAMPRSWSRKKQGELVGSSHIFKPDLSNLLKFVEDIATGIIYNDDCIIAQVMAKKVYGPEPSTKFTLTQL